MLELWVLAGALDNALVWPVGRYVSLGALLASPWAVGLSSLAGCRAGLGFPEREQKGRLGNTGTMPVEFKSVRVQFPLCSRLFPVRYSFGIQREIPLRWQEEVGYHFLLWFSSIQIFFRIPSSSALLLAIIHTVLNIVETLFRQGEGCQKL